MRHSPPAALERACRVDKRSRCGGKSLSKSANGARRMVEDAPKKLLFEVPCILFFTR
jgi:hypothetical protein